MGVTIATMLPENIKELRRKYRYLKCQTAPKASFHPVEFAAMKQHIVISAVGSDRVGMVHELSKAIADCGGGISGSRVNSLRHECSMFSPVNGNWPYPPPHCGGGKKIAYRDELNIHVSPSRRTWAR